MKSEIEQHLVTIKREAEEIQKNYDKRDVLINMRYEKPVGSSVIHVDTLSRICKQIYNGVPWEKAIDEVLNEMYKSIGKGTYKAYRNDYRLFFRRIINTIVKEE